MELLDIIERVDLSAGNKGLRDRIINTLRTFFEDHSGTFPVCDSITDFYIRSLGGRRTQQDTNWWSRTFLEAKTLSEAIKNKTRERELSDQNRQANLCILELELFTSKMLAMARQRNPEELKSAEEYLLRTAVLHRYIYLKISPA